MPRTGATLAWLVIIAGAIGLNIARYPAVSQMAGLNLGAQPTEAAPAASTPAAARSPRDNGPAAEPAASKPRAAAKAAQPAVPAHPAEPKTPPAPAESVPAARPADAERPAPVATKTSLPIAPHADSNDPADQLAAVPPLVPVDQPAAMPAVNNGVERLPRVEDETQP